MPSTDITLPKTLVDYCETRTRVIEHIQTAQRLLDEAERIMDSMGAVLYPYEGRLRDSVRVITRKLDQRLWIHAFDLTGFRQVMDAEACNEFNASLEREPPAFTVENVRAQFITASQTAEMMFARGLVNAFLSLSKGHKTNTNSPFKVNEKAVLTCMTRWWYGTLEVISSYCRGTDRLNDIDRVIKTLDGKKHTQRELEFACNAAWKKGGNRYDDDYYEIKGFKNGNLHIRFKRTDLLEKANKVIAAYYDGCALAKGGMSS